VRLPTELLVVVLTLEVVRVASRFAKDISDQREKAGQRTSRSAVTPRALGQILGIAGILLAARRRRPRVELWCAFE
jgi:hypothetical protein